MPTDEQCDAQYHCGIGELLSTAYQREFSMLEMGKCKTKFSTFKEWYTTLNQDQRGRVDQLLARNFWEGIKKPTHDLRRRVSDKLGGNPATLSQLFKIVI